PVGLLEVPHREERHRELRLREAEEEVGLVLSRVPTLQQAPVARRGIELLPRVVPGRDIFDAQGARLVHQARELHLGVAAGAGNWRAPLEVVADERGYDTVVDGAL